MAKVIFFDIFFEKHLHLNAVEYTHLAFDVHFQEDFHIIPDHIFASCFSLSQKLFRNLSLKVSFFFYDIWLAFLYKFYIKN